MECPCPCADCGDFFPLNSLHFIYEPGESTSDVGVCDECWEEREAEAIDEEDDCDDDD